MASFDFAPLILPNPVSEDVSFYRRWRIDCGGEVWATTDTPIMHIGDFAYGGRYGDLPQAPFGTR